MQRAGTSLLSYGTRIGFARRDACAHRRIPGSFTTRQQPGLTIMAMALPVTSRSRYVDVARQVSPGRRSRSLSSPASSPRVVMRCAHLPLQLLREPRRHDDQDDDGLLRAGPSALLLAGLTLRSDGPYSGRSSCARSQAVDESPVTHQRSALVGLSAASANAAFTSPRGRSRGLSPRLRPSRHASS